MATKLNQIIAIKKGLQSRTASELTALHRSSQEESLFNGFVKTYRKLDEQSKEELPAESKKVQIRSQDILKSLQKIMVELFDVTATNDYSNLQAVADVVVDGKVLIERAPVTYLMFLTKQLNDLTTFISKVPILDENEDWTLDPNQDIYKTPTISTHRQKKVQKPIVLVEATKEHPAQAQLISEDVLVGYWDNVKHSGAFPRPRKEEILERLEKLSQAVDFAREQANSTEAVEKRVGGALFEYLLN